MNKENKGDLISRRVLTGLISDKSIPIKIEEEKRGEWQNSSGVLLSDIYKIIDNAPTVEPCKDCEDRRQAEYIRHGSSWHELQALRKFKEEHERPQGEWIPVSERLPNRNGVYNVTRKLKEGETIYFISDASYFDGQNTWHRDVCVNHGRPYLTDIIAWQEKPEPYKEGDAE